jgi:hypothetical protein
MGKTKLHKYERVKDLPNVTFTQFGESKLPMGYPWYAQGYRGMEKVLELVCGKGEHSFSFAAVNPGKLYDLEDLFRYEVFKMLKSEGKITDAVIENMLSWPPTRRAPQRLQCVLRTGHLAP